MKLHESLGHVVVDGSRGLVGTDGAGVGPGAGGYRVLA